MSISFSHKDQVINADLRVLVDSFLSIQLTTKEQHINVPFFGSVTLTFLNKHTIEAFRQLHTVPSLVDCICVRQWRDGFRSNEGVEYEISIQNVATFCHAADLCSITFDNCWVKISQI